MIKFYFKRSIAIQAMLLVLFIVSANPTYLFAQDTQFALPGDFEAPYEFLNTIVDGQIDADEDGIYDIGQPCSCMGNMPIVNGETADGWFQTHIVVATGVSGQLWQVENSQFAFNVGGETPILIGDVLLEIGTSGVYALPVWHKSGEQFAIIVESPMLSPGETFGPLSGRCFYPTPAIDNLGDIYCTIEDDFIIDASVTTGLGGWLTVVPDDDQWTITRLEDGMQWFTDVFSPEGYGPGTYEISYWVDAGTNAYQAYHSTGCETEVLDTIEVQVAVQTMACNSLLNISVGAACTQTVPSNLLLAGSPPSGANFIIDVTAPDGTSLGDQISALYHGQVLTAEITDACTMSSCETLLSISDLVDPVLSIPTDVVLNCTESEDPSFTGFAFADDCNEVSVTYTDDVFEDECANPTVVITRTWRAEDIAGNVTIEDQIIEIYRAGPNSFAFPPNVVYGCDEYMADPSISDPTPEGAGLPTLVDIPRCRLIYTHQDDTIQNIGFDFIILREWIMLDLCGAVLFEVDMNGNPNMQVIRIADTIAPIVEVEALQAGATIPPAEPGDPCLSQGFLSPPLSITDCSPAVVYIHTPIGEAVYVNGENGLNGGNIPTPGLPLGEYEIVYEAIDERGNSEFYPTTVTIFDNLPPIMICDGEINLTLQPDGTAQLFATDVDEGSRDDCCNGDLLIKLLSEPDSLFRPFVEFDCTNETIDVVVRMWDCFDNFNDCEASISVTDNIPVVLESEPVDQSVYCYDDISAFLTADFMPPVFSDVCSFEVSFIAEQFLNDCGEGHISRTWTASDHPGNPLVFATQTVDVAAYFDYEATIPADQSFACGTMQVFDDMQIVSSVGCEMTTLEVVEDTLSSINTACLEIARTHRLINACRYDGTSEPLILPRIDTNDEGMELGDAYVLKITGDSVFTIIDGVQEFIGIETGYYEYTQIIGFQDNTDPEIGLSIGTVFCISDPNECVAPVNLPLLISDNCTEDLLVTYQVRQAGTTFDTDTLGVLALIEGEWEINGNYPLGDYIIKVNATDNCGNLTEIESTIFIEDCVFPTLTCMENPVLHLPSDGGLWVYPGQLAAEISDNCGIETFTLNGLDSLWLDCDFLGEQNFNLAATDINGFQASCTANVQLLDTTYFCTPNVNIQGNIKREDDQGIEGVVVYLMGGASASTITDANGYYEFLDLPPGQDYHIQPVKDDDHPNGVSTLDIIKVSKHILIIEQFDSPFKNIAGDVNRSENVSTLDLIRIRKIVLNLDTMFANNTSWRFIDDAHVFPSPNDTWAMPLSETAIRATVIEDQIIDFTGSKTGDVNNSAVPNFEQEEIDFRSTTPVIAAEQEFHAGELVTFYLNTGRHQFSGGQFSLTWDEDILDFQQYVPTRLCPAEQVKLPRQGNATLNACWYLPSENNEQVVVLEFIAKQSGKLSKTIKWGGEVAPELYLNSWGEDEIHTPVLEWKKEAEIVQPDNSFGVQVYPNPFSNSLNFNFQLSKDQEVYLRLYNVYGQLIYEAKNYFEKGINQWQFQDVNWMPMNGLLYYQIQTDDGERTIGEVLKF